MFKKVSCAVLLVLFILSQNSCTEGTLKDSSKDNNTEKDLSIPSKTVLSKDDKLKLTIYHNAEIDVQNCAYNIEPDTILPVTQEMDLQQKAELIAKTISNQYFSGLRIKVSLVDSLKGQRCLHVNLIENDDFENTLIPSWNQNFSASCSASWTKNILDANFYQKDYKGKWIDTVQYYYEGELNGMDELQ